MTQPNFTPGPWNHVEALPTCVWANGLWVASTNVETFPSHEEQTANAILIAAAPDMYAALKAVRKFTRQSDDSDWGEVEALVNAALKKAGRR